MKTLCRLCFLCIVHIGLSTVSGTAQNLPRFDFPESSMRWLWYYEYLNSFDSCSVKCSYGEFALVAPDTTVLIYLRIRYRDIRGGVITCLLPGTNAQGRDTVLERLSRSQPFDIPAGSVIRFYRALSVSWPCRDTLVHPPPRYPAPEPVNLHEYGLGFTPPDCILDTTEFVVTLVRESDGTVLLTLDSIGMMPHGGRRVPPRYGTEPDLYVRTIQLPPSLAGERAYIQISPRRYGPTPFGMVMRARRWCMAESLHRLNTDTLGVIPSTTVLYDSLLEERNRAIFAYVDSVGRATGCAVIVPFLEDPAKNPVRERQLKDSLLAMINRAGYIYEDGNRNPYDLNDTALQRCFQLEIEKDLWYLHTFDGYDTSSYVRYQARYSGNGRNNALPLLDPEPGEMFSILSPIVGEDEPITIYSTVTTGKLRVRFYTLSGKLAKEFDYRFVKGINQFNPRLAAGLYSMQITGDMLPAPVQKRVLIGR